LFTCSAKIANNIAILGVAYKYSPSECHLITSKIEHKSVLNVFKHLEEMGYSVTYLDVDRYGRVNLAQLSKSLRKETRLVSIQAFNSEIGIMQDMKKISAVVHRHSNALLHSDISQLFCKYPVDVSFLDMATFSGYKIGSPKGIAALYVKDFQKLTPIVFGSGNSLWPGTVPTELVSSFASAVKVYKMDLQKVTSLFEILRKEIMKIEDVFINSINPTHVFSVSIKGVLLKDVIQEMKDFSFSSGCSCLGQGESNVKEAIDPEGKLPSCTLRLSFSDSVSPAMIIKFAARLHFVFDTLRKRKKVTEGCENDNSKLVDILSDIKL